MTNCKKCEAPGLVILRLKDHYCENCFITNINHKFRACIGKNRAISPNENVLICLSGGISSLVLLDMIHNSISLGNHKKLRITPYFMHIIDSTCSKNLENIAPALISQCKQYGFDIHIVHMSDYMQKEYKLTEAGSIPPNTNEPDLQAMKNGISHTVWNDLSLKIRRHLFIRVAKQLHCKYVFTADTTATLASSLLSNLTIGRGAQVQDDVSFCDARNEVKIMRPMKDISKEELEYYIKIRNINVLSHKKKQVNSIQSVIETFITELQDSFPGTISTICKTADKIGVHSETDLRKKCIVCESTLSSKNTKLSALDATNFSRTISYGKLREESGSTSKDGIHDNELVEKSMFPYIHEHLCYSCSRNYAEINNSKKLPSYVQDLLKIN